MSDDPPSAALLRFARRQARVTTEDDRRCEQRHYVAVPVVVQQLDEHLHAYGLPLAAATRDISPHGIGLILDRALQQHLIAVQFTWEGDLVCVLSEMLWRMPLGPFDYVGTRVLEELEELPRPKR